MYAYPLQRPLRRGPLCRHFTTGGCGQKPWASSAAAVRLLGMRRAVWRMTLLLPLCHPHPALLPHRLPHPPLHQWLHDVLFCREWFCSDCSVFISPPLLCHCHHHGQDHIIMFGIWKMTAFTTLSLSLSTFFLYTVSLTRTRHASINTLIHRINSFHLWLLICLLLEKMMYLENVCMLCVVLLKSVFFWTFCVFVLAFLHRHHPQWLHGTVCFVETGCTHHSLSLSLSHPTFMSSFSVTAWCCLFSGEWLHCAHHSLSHPTFLSSLHDVSLGQRFVFCSICEEV